MATVLLRQVMEALECGRFLTDKRLRGVAFTLEPRGNNCPSKVYAVADLPEDIRPAVEYYLTHGRPQPREVLPAAPPAAPADIDGDIRALLDQAIKSSRKSRKRISAEMTVLVGREVTKFMLDSYTATSRTQYRFPLQLAVAFEIATGSYCITQFLAERRDCALLVGEDKALVALARIERLKLGLEAQAQAIRDDLNNKRASTPHETDR